MRSLAVCISMLVLLGACKATQEDGQPPNDDQVEPTETSSAQSSEVTSRLDTSLLFLYFETTPCFGSCPVFTMKIYHNGFATYTGTRFVDNIGEFDGRLTLQQMSGIKEQAQLIEFFSLNSEYDAPVTDLPTITTYLNIEGQQHRVKARMNIPDELQAFHKYLKELSEQIEWAPSAINKD